MATTAPTTVVTPSVNAEVGDQIAPIQLAYLGIVSPEAGTYRAGALVVDALGLPVEFRYTDLVKPSRIQQILYGKSLGPYLKQQVLLESVLQGLKQPYALLLTQEDCLVSRPLSVPIIRLVGTQTAALGKTVGEIKPVGLADWLLQVTPEGSPVRVSVAPQGPPEQLQSLVLPWLEALVQAGNTLDLLEPFERVEAALQTLS